MKLAIKHFIAQNGERFSQLYDVENMEIGFPLFYPSAYTSRQLRMGIMHNTQKDELRAIKKLYEWADRENLDFDSIFLSKAFLRPHQIASLAQSLRTSDRDGTAISGLKYNSYLSTVASYLAWYAAEIITDSNSPAVSKSIDKMFEATKAKKVRKTGSQYRKNQSILAKKLSKETKRTLVQLFHNPFTNLTQPNQRPIRFRNVLILRILYVTGIRLGELLGLRLQDFIPSSGGEPAYLVVRRYHDDSLDDRPIQPVSKTLARKLPIDLNLEGAISEYLKMRADVQHAGFSEHDFLLINHLQITRQGKAINESTFRSALNVLQQKFPTLKGLHPHLLRHDWNYRFSIKASEIGMSETEERSTREYLMGWVEGSSSASLYNRRHIQEQAAEIGLKIANDTAKRNQLPGKNVG
jgi:site-specific recombinase XerD